MPDQCPSFLLVTSFYPEFLGALYDLHPEWRDLGYIEQVDQLLDCGFSAVGAYRHGLRRLGCHVDVVIVNADEAQAAWARENGFPMDDGGDVQERRRRVVQAQIERLRPDVLYSFEWSPLGDAFFARVRKSARLTVGQVASPLPAGRTYAAYDLMISSVPPLVDHFRSRGIPSEPLRLAFDHRALSRIEEAGPAYDVTFIGGFAPSHDDRIPWLERLLRDLAVNVFGYGLERVPAGSPIHAHYRGPCWGWAMYETLKRSRVTLNLHARIATGRPDDGRYANNMRLYEATGVGTCLVTDAKRNLAELFAPGREVMTFGDVDECVEVVRRLAADKPLRRKLALAGQRRTLEAHTYDRRMEELLGILRPRLGGTAGERRSTGDGKAGALLSPRP